jgi:hypothetical protein
MPDDKPRDKSQRDPKPQVADADFLFHDAPAGVPSSPSPHPAAKGATGANEVFDLVDVPDSATDPVGDRPPIAVSKAPGEQPRAPSGTPRKERKTDDAALNPSDLVEETWTRWGEWRLNLIVVGAWVALILLLVYFVFGQDHLGLSFILLIVGAVVAAVLSYPILITLERPVRITPEQAVRDYYSALSHHVPHFRRMWLLLSKAAKISSAFGSFEGFKGYWKDQLGQLRQGHAGPLTPLVFEVINFKAEKSAGKTRIDATFSVNVLVRGQRPAGAIHTIPASISLVRGPDSMWYLENGTLARAEPATRSREGT